MRRKRNVLHKSRSWRWLNTAYEPQQTRPFLKEKNANMQVLVDRTNKIFTIEPCLVWNLRCIVQCEHRNVHHPKDVTARTEQEVLPPHQAPVSDSRKDQTSHHAQETLTSIPAQHYSSQQEHRCRLDTRKQDRSRKVWIHQVEENGGGQKEGQERKKQVAGLMGRGEKGGEGGFTVKISESTEVGWNINIWLHVVIH